MRRECVERARERGLSVASARFFLGCCARVASVLHSFGLHVACVDTRVACAWCKHAPQPRMPRVAPMLHQCSTNVAYMLHTCCICVAATLTIRRMCEYVACVLQPWCRVHCMSYIRCVRANIYIALSMLHICSSIFGQAYGLDSYGLYSYGLYVQRPVCCISVRVSLGIGHSHTI